MYIWIVGLGGIGKKVSALIVVLVFLFSGYSVHEGTFKPVYAGKFYYENLTKRDVSLVQQRLRLDEPAAAIVSTSLQEDGWSNEPLIESPVSVRGGALKKAIPSNGEWLEAASTGVLATAVSMAVLYLGGARFDWA